MNGRVRTRHCFQRQPRCEWSVEYSREHVVNLPFSRAWYVASINPRCCGSIVPASSGGIEKNGASKARTSSSKKWPARVEIFATISYDIEQHGDGGVPYLASWGWNRRTHRYLAYLWETLWMHSVDSRALSRRSRYLQLAEISGTCR